MIASLPMYDRAETAVANDALWAGMRAALGYGPDRLNRNGDLWADWRNPDLLVSQTCGYPYRAHLHGHVQVLGTPDHGLPGCPPGYYNSVLIARRDDARTTPEDFAAARFAFNEPLSQSGWAAPQTFAATRGFAFTRPIQTGGHIISAQAVSDGHADIAAIDALTWALIQRHDAFAAVLKEIARTEPTPALPYITARGRDATALTDVLTHAIAQLAPKHRDALMLRDLVQIPASLYLAIPSPAAPHNAAQLA
ncbi:MAG: PhnD/SsuA/transferrin family substrate-binding protein [Roseovarius sp.]